MPKSKKTDIIKPLAELISLKGKRALITGSASGIGKAIAYRFAEAGADLELVDINKKSLEMVKNEFSNFQMEINLHQVDLSKKDQIDILWEKLKGKEPDILVNNAGIFPLKNFLQVEKSFLEEVVETNLNSVYWMCQHMIKSRLKKGGVIINLGSIEALVPFKDDLVHYSFSKSGVIAITRSLAKEYGRRGFRINVVLPGGTMTPGSKNIAKDIYKFKFGLIKSGIEYRQRLPLGRFGQPDEIARMVLILASNFASYVHGASIPIDGGFLVA